MSRDFKVIPTYNGTALSRQSRAISALKPTGTLTESYPRSGANLVNLVPGGWTTGKLYMTAVYLDAGEIATGLAFRTGTTAAGTPTNWWFALYDSARALLRQSADQLTAAWAASTRVALNFTSAYTITTSGLYYAGFSMKATTMPSIFGVSGSALIGGQAPILAGSTSDTGLLGVAPNPAGAITSVVQVPYAEVV